MDFLKNQIKAKVAGKVMNEVMQNPEKVFTAGASVAAVAQDPLKLASAPKVIGNIFQGAVNGAMNAAKSSKF
jgi:hypothetical protein